MGIPQADRSVEHLRIGQQVLTEVELDLLHLHEGGNSRLECHSFVCRRSYLKTSEVRSDRFVIVDRPRTVKHFQIAQKVLSEIVFGFLERRQREKRISKVYVLEECGTSGWRFPSSKAKNRCRWYTQQSRAGQAGASGYR